MKKIDENFVVEAVKRYLAPKWTVVSQPELHEKGCDLVLRDSENKGDGRRFLIECKGKSYSKCQSLNTVH